MSLKLTKNLLTAKISEYLEVIPDDLHPFIIKIKNAFKTDKEEDAENTSIANGYIRWDALCQLFNKHFSKFVMILFFSFYLFFNSSNSDFNS